MRRPTFGVLANCLEKHVKVQKEALIRSDLSMVTLYSPHMDFSSVRKYFELLTFTWNKGKICLVCLD